jgi:hypothetical protein
MLVVDQNVRFAEVVVTSLKPDGVADGVVNLLDTTCYGRRVLTTARLLPVGSRGILSCFFSLAAVSTRKPVVGFAVLLSIASVREGPIRL